MNQRNKGVRIQLLQRGLRVLTHRLGCSAPCPCLNMLLVSLGLGEENQGIAGQSGKEVPVVEVGAARLVTPCLGVTKPQDNIRF